MLFKRLAFGVATVALGVASAASTYKVQLDAPLSIGTTELKAGEYKVEMQGDKAVFKNGKTTIEVPASHQNVEVPEPGGKALTQHFEGVFSQLIRLNVNKVAASDDDVRVDVIAELVNLSLK